MYETKNINDADIDEYLNSTETPSLSEELKQFCDQSPTKLEIRNAVFDMKSGKSPGFDGLNSEFYQCFWTDIEVLFNNIVDYIYERKEMSFTQRLAIITLIFKKGERTSLKNYRPLSLTNTDYKIIAFVLARRLQTVIDKLIGNKLSFLKSLGRKPPSILISREMTLKDNHKMKTFLIIITHAGNFLLLLMLLIS